HLSAVEAAAALGEAEVGGASVGSRDLTFRPGRYAPRDLTIDIGTAGATALVLQTLHLPLALRAERPVRVTLGGGTFNESAPSLPFLATTWVAHLALLGAPISLAMPSAGFYPRGGGRLDAWIEPAPAGLRPLVQDGRGPLVGIRGEAGVAQLPSGVAERMRAQAERALAGRGLAEIELVRWSGPVRGRPQPRRRTRREPSQHVRRPRQRGKPAEAVADEAVDELLAFEDVADGAIDPHSADQVLIPRAAPGPSRYTVSEVTEHLRTNVATIREFLDRTIEVEEPGRGRPGRVSIS
ncbi:MAG: RNA 3'-terminal phosphate cyclase, partial [Singulisphaera sp.]